MRSIWFDTHTMTTRQPPPFEEGARYDTVVAGAGLTGLATALLLARSGQRVALLEARHLGSVTTGNTTAKLSLLQGLTLSDILRHQNEDVLGAYVEANREGQSWLLRLLDEHGVQYQRRTAYTYTTSDSNHGALRAELDASHRAGLDVEWVEETELPFDVRGAIALRDQAQIHPLQVLDLLAAAFVEHGGHLFEGVRLTDANTNAPDCPVRVTTTLGHLRTDHVILATGIPVLDRGGYFAKVVPMRSYATAHRVDAPVQGMYLGIDDPTRSLRSVPTADGELLLVGGNGHVSGRTKSEQAAITDLEDWTKAHFPGAEMTHTWSAQDYRASDRVPFVGRMPRTSGRVFVATGYNKWGMTNAVAAALNLSGQILGGSMPWAATLNKRGTASQVLGGVGANVSVAYEMAKDWTQTTLRALPDEDPAEGEGFVGRGRGGAPVAVSTVDGVTCRLSAVCSHMGGIVRWNDAEGSWDCPLHGSRFAPDGSLLEGPAVEGLENA